MRGQYFLRIFIGFLFFLTITVTPAAAESTASKPPLKQEELDQLLAPLALFPDSLLSQIFMASTYPLEIVEADRWAQKNKTLKGDTLAAALEKQAWDPSVKSLVNFPDVLTMLSEKLTQTVKLGDAFLADQKQVMASVQNLRAKAQAEGNLKSTKEQTVSTDAETIVIESADPEVVYVPVYDPMVVYGSWWYPSYPPYYYYPPGYAGAAYVFTAGVVIGVAWGYAWGHCDWHHSDIDIDINRNITVNDNIDRSQFAEKKGNWQHDASHRQGVPYSDQTTAQKFGRGTTDQAVQSREEFRGRADEGREALDKAGTNEFKGNSAAKKKDYPSNGGVFDDLDQGKQASDFSNRGRDSLASPGVKPRAGGGGAGFSGGRR